MKTALIALALVAGLARVAHADGFFGGCREEEGYMGCTTDNGNGGWTCNCDTRRSTSRNAASIGSALGLLGIVAYRLGRKRRRP